MSASGAPSNDKWCWDFDPKSVEHKPPPSSVDPAVPKPHEILHIELDGTSPRRTILVSAPYMINNLDRFRPVFERLNMEVLVPDVVESLSEEKLLALAGKYDASICGNDKYTERVCEAMAPRLKGVCKWGTGIDSIDKPAAERHGIEVRNVVNCFSVPVADTVMGYILAFARRHREMDAMVKAGVWQKIPGHALRECTLGIVGCGNVGKHIVLRAAAFGMRILVNDLVEVDADFLGRYNATQVSLDTLLRESDYVSLNCDLNPESRGLVNKTTLAKMKPTAVLVNAARGPVVVQQDLVDALLRKELRGAALDTNEKEPLDKDCPLFNFDNVYLAPHNASNSPVTWELTHWKTIRNVCEILKVPIKLFKPSS